MTVSTTANRADYLGNGATTSFAVPFYFPDPTNLLVLSTVVATGVSTPLVLNSDYTVSGAGASAGGTVTTTAAFPSGSKLSILLNLSYTQGTHYVENDPFHAATIEANVDYLTLLAKQTAEVAGRSIQVAQSDSGVSVILPPAAQRAGLLAAFDSQGGITAVAPVAGTATALATQLAGSNGANGIGYGATTVKAALDSQAASIASQGATITTLQNIDIDAVHEFVTNIAAGTAGTVACFGDSTMWGADPANLGNQVAIPPPLQLQNLVNNYHGNTALTVTNNAISGTTCTQMIAGTDGSGSTFAAKMAVSGASIVYCNHGVNDAFGASSTTPAAYRTALLSFVKIVRAVNKTPVLVTPHPCLTIGTFGSQARAEATARFAQIMRDVAREHGVQLVDTNYVLSARMNIDGILPLAVLADGVHAPQAVYVVAGNQLTVALLGAQTQTFLAPGQRLPASSSAIKATGQSISPSTSSRVGVVTTTGTGAPQTLRMVFQVATPGLDLVLSHPIFSNGASAVDVSLDGVSQGSLSMLAGGFPSPFWQDFETVVARNVPVGMHILILTTSSTGGAGAFALRSRLAEKPLLLPSGSAVPRQTVLLSPKLELSSNVATTMTVFDTMPMSRFIDAVDFEWTAQMPINSAVIIGGNIGTNGGAAACERAVSIGLNGSGFVQVDEATAPGTYSSSVLNATNLSTASHLFRVTISTAGLVTVYVDGTALGSTATLTGPFKGGLLGLYKSAGAGTTLTLNNVCRSWGL